QMKPLENEKELENQSDEKLVRQKRLMSFMMSKNVPPVPSNEERKPYGEYHSNPLSLSMFWWLNPILKTGYKRTINLNDLFKLEDDQKTEYLYTKFKTFFDIE
ncbi:hypothetical protein C6P40_005225, partial [Pichia californica]